MSFKGLFSRITCLLILAVVTLAGTSGFSGVASGVSPAFLYAAKDGGTVSGNDIEDDDDEDDDDTVSGNDIRKEKEAYTIKYVANVPAGEEYKGEEFEEDFELEEAALISQNIFEREYYEFVEWNSEPDGTGTSYEPGKTFSFDAQDKDVFTLYAQWKAKTYKITYELYGAINSSKNPVSYVYNSAPVTLENPSKIGFTFNGWYLDSKFTKKVSAIEKGYFGDLTLYAKFTEHSYSIVFDGNGGTGSMKGISNVRFGESVKIPKNEFTRTGYVLKGFNTVKNGTGISVAANTYTQGLSAVDKAKVTLYAQWELKEYKIKYKLDGGTNSSKNPATYTIKTSTIKLSNPTKTGYTFGGWFTDSKFKKPITQIKKGAKKNYTLYAKWTVNTYSIKFSGNGGIGSMKIMKDIKYSSAKYLRKNTFTKEGYVFAGWNTKKNGKGTFYKDKQKVKKLTAKNRKTITLYAQWEPIKYNIKFSGNGADYGSMDKLKGLSYDKSYKLPQNEFERDGYVFAGWNTKKSGTGTAYKNLAKIKNLTTVNNKTITLYARWKKNGTNEDMTDEEVFDFLVENGMNDYGAAAMMGNMYAESGLSSINLENIYNERLHMTDEEYTEAVDCGDYSEASFVGDSAGYGLCQWTSSGRKQGLYSYAEKNACSIGNKEMQLEYLIIELSGAYSSVFDVLKNAKDLKSASNTVLFDFENPRDQSKAVQAKRLAYSKYYYNEYSGESDEDDDESMTEEDCPFSVTVNTTLNIRQGPGTDYPKAGVISVGTDTYVIIHVKEGAGSSIGWGQLEDGRGWISLDYVSKVKD